MNKGRGARFFIHLRHCVTPPPAEDKKIGAREKEQGTSDKGAREKGKG
jgi:hypothetical protein